jgi:hypothetical protein
MNPATLPTVAEDLQGDGRWISMVRTCLVYLLWNLTSYRLETLRTFVTIVVKLGWCSYVYVVLEVSELRERKYVPMY